MKVLKDIARKRLLINKNETVFVIAVIAIAVEALITVLSLSINYFEFYLYHAAALTGNSMETVVKNGLSNMSDIWEYVVEFTMYFRSYDVPSSYAEFVSPPSAGNSDSVFAPVALVENLPFVIIFMVIFVLGVSCVALSIVFAACKRERSGFFSLLLASGATDKQIKKCAFYESVYYCAFAFPAGVVSGIIGIYVAELTAHALFRSTAYNGIQLSVNFKASLVAVLVALAFVFLSVCVFSRKACKKLSVKMTATQLRQIAGTDIGICTFTAKPGAYKRKGIEYFIAIRNFQNNFGKYFKIIAMTVFYTSIAAFTIAIFNVIRNYNNQEIFVLGKDLLSFTFAFQYYFGIVAICLCIVSVASTFIAVFTNINSNISEYAVMISSGASIKSVLKAVRLESAICSVSGILVSLASILYSVSFLMEIYSDDSSVNFGSFENTVVVTAVSLTFFLISIVITTIMINRKMKKLDVIKTLRDYFY